MKGRSPEGREWTTLLDTNARPVEISVPSLYPLRLEYDGDGRLVAARQGTGEAERILGFEYAASGWLKAVTNQLGQRIEYAVDRIGRVTNAVAPDGATVRIGYDRSEQPVTVVAPAGGTNAFAYNPTLDLVRETPPLVDGTSNTTVWTYNSDRQVVTATLPSGTVITNTFDPGKGRLTDVQWPEDSLTIGYSASGQVAGSVLPTTASSSPSRNGPGR